MKESKESREATSFFRLARTNCCNYSPTGPERIAHYCWEGRGAKGVCLLATDKACPWFIRAVLPASPEIQGTWVAAHDPRPMALTGKRRCITCGKMFKTKSNRSTRCPVCAAISRTASYRQSKRKTRAEGYSVHT